MLRCKIMIAAALLALAVPSLAAAKKKSKKAPPADDPSAALSAAVSAQGDKIGDCALAGAAPGAKVTVGARVTLTGAGQVVDLEVTIEPGGAAADRARRCVEQVLRAIAYPKTHAPLVTIQRNWTFAVGN